MVSQKLVARDIQSYIHKIHIFPWPVSRECLPQEPGRIEYYICLCGHLGDVSEIQASLDISDLLNCHKELTSSSALSTVTCFRS